MRQVYKVLLTRGTVLYATDNETRPLLAEFIEGGPAWSVTVAATPG